MRIRVLQHVPHEGPGAIAEWATARGHELSTTRFDRGEEALHPGDHVAGEQVVAAHRLFVVGPVVHEADQGPEPAGQLRQPADRLDRVVRRADDGAAPLDHLVGEALGVVGPL